MEHYISCHHELSSTVSSFQPPAVGIHAWEQEFFVWKENVGGGLHYCLEEYMGGGSGLAPKYRKEYMGGLGLHRYEEYLLDSPASEVYSPASEIYILLLQTCILLLQICILLPENIYI